MNQQTVRIDSGPYSVQINRQGAALTNLQFDGRDFMPKPLEEEPGKSYHGSIIAPWPNRVRDGVYTFKGERYQLPVNESDRGNALHGFSAQKQWEFTKIGGSEVVLETSVGGIPGFPWNIQLRVEYKAAISGVSIKFYAHNKSNTDAPFGWAFHPYFLVPDSSSDTLILKTSASRVVMPDLERLLPFVEKRVERTPFDFSQGKSANLEFLDHAFSGFDWDKNGYTSADLSGPSNFRLRMSWDSSLPWLQLHRPLHPNLQPSLVVEPMTCPPDALNSGRDLVLLEPDEVFSSHIHLRISQS